MPPIDEPTTWARATPRWASNAAASSAIWRVVYGWGGRPPRPAVVGGDDPEPPSQGREQRFPAQGVPAEAVDEQERVAAARFLVVAVDPVDPDERRGGLLCRVGPRRGGAGPMERYSTAVTTDGNHGVKHAEA